MILDEEVYLEYNVNAFLEHHGVKGMKWGIRHDPERKARRQAHRVEKYEKKAAFLQTTINELDAELAKTKRWQWHRRSELGSAKDFASKQRETALRDIEAVKKGKLTSVQKKLLIGAGGVAGILLAFGAFKMGQSGQLRQMAGKAFLKDKLITRWKVDGSLSRQMSPDEIMSSVVKPLNPNYSKPNSFGSKFNCRRCTFAYEMRRRGYDVSATQAMTGLGQDVSGEFNATSPLGSKPVKITDIARAIGGGHSSPQAKEALSKFGGQSGLGKNTIDMLDGKDNSKSIFRALSRHPEGARGELGVKFEMGGAHSVAWEKIHGKIYIIDSQRGKIFKNPTEFDDDIGHMVGSAGFTRLDNIQLNDDFLGRWLKNAKH